MNDLATFFTIAVPLLLLVAASALIARPLPACSECGLYVPRRRIVDHYLDTHNVTPAVVR